VFHRNARLNLHGRLLLVDRVCRLGRPVSHVAKELGISRQCAHRWVNRFRAEGRAGLVDRSSRPHCSPRRPAAAVEWLVLEQRPRHRRGQDWLAPETGLASTTSLSRGVCVCPLGVAPTRSRGISRHSGGARSSASRYSRSSVILDLLNNCNPLRAQTCRTLAMPYGARNTSGISPDISSDISSDISAIRLEELLVSGD
jgi:transposase-like protein